MKKDLRDFFLLLGRYLHGQWRSVVVGVTIEIVAELCALASPLITRYIVDFVIVGKHYLYFRPLILVSVYMLLIFLFASLASNWILTKSFKSILAKLKLDIFKVLQFASASFFEVEQSGGISYRLHEDTDSLVSSWVQLVVVLPMQLILLIGAIFMVRWNITLALFTFVVLAVQSCIIVMFKTPTLNYARRTQAKEQDLNAYTVGHFRRIELVRAISTERVEQKNFSRSLQELAQLETKAFMVSKSSSVLQALISNAWSLFILFYGGMLTIHGKMTIGTLMAFMMFAGILYQPIAGLTNLILSFQRVRVNVVRVKEYLETKPDVTERSNAIDFTPGEGKIGIEGVSFSYRGENVLSDIYLEFLPHSLIAIVGPTGSGKTTLAKLIVRFFDPKEGRILLDGTDIRDIRLSSLRRSVTLFLQKDYVFNGTVYENITYGVADSSREKIERAIDEAAVDFIGKLPHGLDTIIGEGGVNLSAGEAQRIALARAFLLHPKVFILDEPTSSVDLATEGKINNAFTELRNNSTVIVIAHRLSTARKADRIVVLENGSIKGVGRHEDLLLENEFYRRINYIPLEQKS